MAEENVFKNAEPSSRDNKNIYNEFLKSTIITRLMNAQMMANEIIFQLTSNTKMKMKLNSLL